MDTYRPGMQLQIYRIWQTFRNFIVAVATREMQEIVKKAFEVLQNIIWKVQAELESTSYI